MEAPATALDGPARAELGTWEHLLAVEMFILTRLAQDRVCAVLGLWGSLLSTLVPHKRFEEFQRLLQHLQLPRDDKSHFTIQTQPNSVQEMHPPLWCDI